MTKEQFYFLQIVNDYTNGIQTRECENIDWSYIVECAKAHQLVPIIYTQCKSILPQNMINEMELHYLGVISNSVNRKKIVDGLLSNFRSESIEYCVVKGSVVSEYYPNWQYRTMGDVDIVVTDKKKTHRIMLHQNFQPISLLECGEWQYKKNGVEIEIHDALLYDSDEVAYDTAKQFFGKYRDFINNNCLDLNYHVVYLFLHLRKHFMKYGVGFRQFLDIAMMTKNCNMLDWKIIEGYLREIDLLSFAQTVCAYNEKWFDVDSPFNHIDISDSLFEESTRYIFQNGVFGFNNSTNKKQIQMLRSQKHRMPFVYMIFDAFKKIFPSYKSMCSSEHYTFLRGKPYLLPIAWVYRFINVIQQKDYDRGKKKITNSFVSKTYMVQREEMLKGWGLL